MNDKKRERRAYSVAYTIARIFLFPFCRPNVSGLNNVPDGPAVFCANHSSNLDPFAMAFALTKKYKIHFIAKIELFRFKPLGKLLSAIGMIPVDRSITDTISVRMSLRCLKDGEKVGIFPEGTRAGAANEVEAKAGAVRIAEKTGVPVVPVYIPRRKNMLKKIHVVIGEPYYMPPRKPKSQPEDYLRLAEDLMDRIEALGGAEVRS